MPRYLLATLVLALVSAGCTGVPPVVVPPPDPVPVEPGAYPAMPSVSAKSTHAFRDTVGMNVHLFMDDTASGDFNQTKARLLELGVSHVRDGLCAPCGWTHDRYVSLGQAGIKSQIIIGWLNKGMPDADANLQVIRDKLLPYTAGIEAPNEPDINAGYSVTAMRDYQTALYSRVKGNPQTAHIPVIGPTLVHRANRAALGDLSAHMDQGNMHPYPGGAPPYSTIVDEKLSSGYISGNKPFSATEIGYHTDLTTTSGHNPASERAVALYTPRTYLEGFRLGIKRTFSYQLVDPLSEADAASRGWSKLENSFGLMRANWTPKPAFLSLRNLMRTMDVVGAQPVASPGAFKFGLEGAGADVQQLLLRSDDGSLALALWRNVSVWDRNAKVELYPAADDFEVVLGEPVSLAQRFNPVDSDAEVRRWANPRRIPVDVAGGPVVIRLTK